MDAVGSAFLEVLVQAIADFVRKELMKFNGLERERSNLISNVKMILAVLREADNMQLSDVQKSWFGDLKDVSYDAVEVLDEYLYEHLRLQVIHLQRVRNSKLISHISARRNIFAHNMAKKFADIIKNIDRLEKMRLTYQVEIHEQTGQNCSRNNRRRRPSSSLPPTPVHGRQNDREKIIHMLLLQPALNCNVQVLPILGEAYIGKTTVAQAVINDEGVSRHFELRPWVHVSSEFNVARITADIIESIQGRSFGSNNLDNLQRHLSKLLRDRRYLLVLDDYRMKNSFPDDWEQLRRPLLSGAAGSKIIVTTSSSAVATTLGTSDYCYQLHGLPQEHCWSLFRQYAGTEFEADFLNNRFKDEVIRKCKGLPFIAVNLGHRLRQEKDRSKWEAIVREENWDCNSIDCMRSHGIYYEQLDSHLKPCLAYCSIFPQNFQFEQEWLIQHWMAQGFIQCQPDTDTADMMDSGNGYFRSFVEESFFQRVHVGHTRERDRYTMSQKMQELAFHVSAGGCYILNKSCNPPSKVRHLTVQLDKIGNQNVFAAISQCASLHTLVVVGGSENYQPAVSIPKNILKNTLKRLRVLDVSNFGLSKLPKSIGDLIHLRCLQLRGNKIRKLPESICRLYNLQTMGLRNCYHLEKLPADINCLRKLMHIDLHMDNHESALFHGSSYHICSLNHMPEGIGRLIGLQTLSRFVISNNSITRQSNIQELSELNNLRGELLVSNLNLVKDAQEAKKADLASKQFLHKIELAWRGHSKEADKIAANLKPASTITELTISGYCGMVCPRWLDSVDCMGHLITVWLHDFKSCRVLPSLGLLPRLKNLYLKSWDELIRINYEYGSTVSFLALEKFHLERMHSLQQWNWNDLCTFAPHLTELVVKNCPQLGELPRCIQNLRDLEDMEIVGCGRLALLPHMNGLTSLQRLEISDCNSIGSLPSTGLPSSLQVLSINNCHQLSRSCMKLGSTVSSVWIDGNRI